MEELSCTLSQNNKLFYFSLPSTKRDIRCFFTNLYVLLQSIVDIVYIIQNFQYYFSLDVHFADSVFHMNTSVTLILRPPAVQDE
jgi:hypothetical protein